MRNSYRGFLLSGVASAALVIATSAASAQTNVNQNSTNSSPVSNPTVGANIINLGTGSLGIGASASTGASGAVSSVSITGINAPFVNPTGGFGTVLQSAVNNAGAPIVNNGVIFG